ncbi:hypothetical protein UlMin_003440 [Ulmus minor]
MAYVSMGEAHRRITDYPNHFSNTVSSQDGTSLKLLLSLSSNSPSFLSLADALNRFSHLRDIVLPLFCTLQNYRLGNLTDAYQAFEKSFFIQEFQNCDSAWALKALYVVAYEIRVLAERADRDLASNGKSLEKLKVASSFLMKVFGVLAEKGLKCVGALYVSCQLFKVYFMLGTIHLCRSVIKSIETTRIFEFEEFPKRDKVTYMYYTVCVEVFNKNFPAECVKEQEALIPLGMWKTYRLNYEYVIVLRLISEVSNFDFFLIKLSKHKDHILLASVFLICFWFPLVSLRRGNKGSGCCSWRHQGNQRLRIGVFLLVSMRFLLINMKKMVTKEDRKAQGSDAAQTEQPPKCKHQLPEYEGVKKYFTQKRDVQIE